MNKHQMIIGAVVILVLVVGFIFMTKSKSDNVATVEQSDSTTQNTMMEKSSSDANMTEKKDTTRYIEYSKEAFEKSAENRRVLFFYANWCPTCREADPNLKVNAQKIPQDLTVIRVNYNDTDTDKKEKDLAKKYGVTYQHTFVQINNEGKEITKWNGGKIDELLANSK